MSSMPTHPATGAADLDAIRRGARAALPDELWHYLMSGGDDDATDALALARHHPIPRPLRPLAGGHTRLSLCGEELAHPILLAPVAYQKLFHRDGELASAVAASAQGGQSVTSSLATTPFPAIVAAAHSGGGRSPWFQLYWQGSRQRTADLLERAWDSGMSVLVFTVDAPVKRSTLVLPAGVHAVNLPAAEGAIDARCGQAGVFETWMAQAPSWDDLAWLRRRTDQPIIIKGLLHADDAARAVELGCSAVVVSSHGGRVLPGAPASVDRLPAIVARVGKQVPVLFDSGIRSGSDVFRALALGATAVLVGRTAMWGLASGGAMGVAQVIRLLRDELEMAMALTGCATLSEITPACLESGHC